VVNYTAAQEGMYLIGIRDVTTGIEFTYNQVKNFAIKYNVPMTDIENTTLDKILEDCKKYKSHEKEGWVIYIDGHRIKLKCDDYVSLHKMLDYISSVNVIIKNIANDTYDDLLSKVPENYKGRVQSVANQVFDYSKRVTAQVREYFNQAPKSDRKEFMIWIEKNVPKELKGYLRLMYDGRSFNVIKTNYGQNAKYKKAKEMDLKLEVD
jgi:hypothetical protein